MNTRTITFNILAGLIAISSVQAAAAQGSTSTASAGELTSSSARFSARTGASSTASYTTSSSASPSAYYAAESANSLNEMHQPGTGDLQEKVLMKINQQLAQGTLSPADASELKTRLNKINATESWYKSFNSPIPALVTANNNLRLTAISNSIAHKQPVSLATANALHEDVDQLISRNLASNHISSSQAEKYYLRLAEIESNLESAKDSNGLSADQSKAMNTTLEQMKSELAQKTR